MGVLPILAFLAAALQSEDSGPRYRDAAQLGASLRAAVAKDPSRARVVTIGKSIGGREIACVEICEGDADAKPAVLVVAGLHGAHLVGTAVAEANAAQILERAKSDMALAAWLREHAIYVVPRVNPDGAEAMFGKPKREQAANDRPVDDDRDRRTGEDPPDDADGDGEITWMRVPDPKGDYLVDASDPRIVRRADRAKGERGTHRLVPEGIDDDGDGAWNEDGPGGVRLDRNFPHGWKEHDGAVGTSAVSEPETRALADFLLAHKNVTAVVVYGLQDNLRKAPKAEAGGGAGSGAGDGGDDAAPAAGPPRGRAARSAPTTVAKDDVPLYERASKLYRESTGLEAEVDDAPADGSFGGWTYFQLGLPSYAARVWSPPAETKAEKKGEEKKGEKKADAKPDAKKPESAPAESRPEKDKEKEKKDKDAEDRSKKERALLEWNDSALGGKGFVAWKPAADPKLAPLGIEIGGWRPGVLLNPPEAELAEIARKHTDFLLALAKESFAKLSFAKAELHPDGAGLATLRASLRNDGTAPALTAMARRTRAVRPVRVKLTVDGGEIVVGRPQILVSELDPQSPLVEWTWVVRGPKGARVRLEASADFAAPAVFEGAIP